MSTINGKEKPLTIHVRLIDANRFMALLSMECRSIPRVGEWIYVLHGHKRPRDVYEVMMVAHQTNGWHSEIFVRSLGSNEDVVPRLTALGRSADIVPRRSQTSRKAI